MLSSLTSLQLPVSSSTASWHLSTPGTIGGSQNPALAQTDISRIAAHFQREAPRIQSASDLLNDPNSLTVVEQALGFSTVVAGPDRETQAALLDSMINVLDFQIPSQIQKFIELYTARAAVTSKGTNQTFSEAHGPHGVLPGQPTATVSESLLAQLPELKASGT